MLLVVDVQLVDLPVELVQVLCAHRLAAHFRHRVELFERLLLDLHIRCGQVMRMHVGPVAATMLLHRVHVELFGDGLGREVVGLGGGQQHGLGLGQLVRLEYATVGLEVLEQLEGGDLAAVDLLDGERGRELRLHELLHVDLEVGLDVLELAVELAVGAHPHARMRHQVAVECAEALFEVHAKVPELVVLLLVDLEALVEQALAALEAVRVLVRE